ncbi:MAG: TrmH family RNA methyltransferase [Candidatus Saccharimonadales bacterium]
MVRDPRNLLDHLKDRTHEDIINELDQNGVSLEIACENTLRDFNMGSIVRTANGFGVRRVHIVGRRQWNKRGAMATNKYVHVYHHPTIEDFMVDMRARNVRVFAIENNCQSESLQHTPLPQNVCLVFGQEGPGISDEFLAVAEKVLHIDQYGSTRSFNVGHAAAIAMYEWSRQHSRK